MFKLIKLSLSFVLLGLCITNGFAQYIPRLCICFEKNTKYLTMDMRKDSTITSFSIVRAGYETEEKREEARKKWSKEYPAFEPQPPISFYINFFSTEKPQKISSVEKNDDCVRIVTINEYRQKDFKMPENARSDLFIFIKKLQDDTYLRWDALMIAVE